MTTVISFAQAAMVAALQLDPPVAPLVERGRVRPYPANVSTAVNVVETTEGRVGDELAIGFDGPTVYETRVQVQCYARVDPDGTAQQAVDPVVEAVVARLLMHPTLGGAVSSLQPSGWQFDADAKGDELACFTFFFEVRLVAAPNVFTPQLS